jgi:PAS domain S-box-containing protein
MTTPTASPKAAILYVDDELENLETFKALFRRDYDVHLADSAKEALIILERINIQVLITDQRMPETSGSDLLEAVADRYPEMTRYMLTGFSDFDPLVDAINRGRLHGYFSKPLDLPLIRERIESALSVYNLNLKNKALNKELQENEERLRATRNYLNNILNSSPSAIIGVAPSGKITSFNAAAEELSGVPLALAKGKPFIEILPTYGECLRYIKQVIRLKKQLLKEKTLKEENHDVCYKNISIFPLTEDPEGVVLRIDDVTERVRFEEAIIQSEKMMSLGGLAAGMAHEINNPLAGILQNAQVIYNRISDNSPKNRKAAEECGTTMDTISAYMEKRRVFSLMESVVESGKRAVHIVDSMLNFSRKSESIHIHHDLRELLDKAVELASNDYGLNKGYDFRNIRIVRHYDPDIPKVPCEKNEISQVFLNILKNGSQAMASQQSQDKKACFVLSARCRGTMVEIEIEDNGPGMDETTSKRIFEPFFTTRSTSGGTGLGLSISYFIIKEKHRGTLTVNSIKERGTRFTIHLPKDA